MRYTFLLILTVVVSCKSSVSHPKTITETAQDSITSYLNGHLHDPSSYELVKFSKLDTDYFDLESETKYIMWGIDRDGALSLAELYAPGHSFSDDERHHEYMNIAKAYQDSIDEFVASFREGEIRGYYMSHTYRAKNKMGALVLNTYQYEFDTLMNITSVNEMGDAQNE